MHWYHWYLLYIMVGVLTISFLPTVRDRAKERRYRRSAFWISVVIVAHLWPLLLLDVIVLLWDRWHK